MSDDYVIVAEQDWNLRNVMRQYLDGLGFRALVTPIAGEAEDFARHIRARFVVLDAELPGISGFEACARIRHADGYGQVPIIMTTATPTRRRSLAADCAGASGILAKPFSMHDLSREIGRFLGEPDPGPARLADAAGPAADPPMRVWEPAASLAWRFGEGSELSAGRRTLETMRQTTRRGA